MSNCELVNDGAVTGGVHIYDQNTDIHVLITKTVTLNTLLCLSFSFALWEARERVISPSNACSLLLNKDHEFLNTMQSREVMMKEMKRVHVGKRRMLFISLMGKQSIGRAEKSFFFFLKKNKQRK